MITWIRTQFARWTEFAGWLPVTVILAIGAWMVLGALVPVQTSETLGALIELAVLLAGALAAAGVTRLVWRRWRQQLSEVQQEDFWARLMQHPHGPLAVFVVNAVLVLCVFVVLLQHFSLR